MATSATKCRKISYGIVGDDEDHNPDWMCQIMYEVLEVVAPTSSSRSYVAYKVPMYDDLYKVFALIKCVDESPERNIITELRLEFVESLKQSDLLTFYGSETISEICCEEFEELSNEHCYQQAS